MSERTKFEAGGGDPEKLEMLKLKIHSAIEEFFASVERLQQEKASSLFAVGGVYSGSHWGTPSEHLFEGDKRAIEQRMQDTKVSADAIDKEDIMKEAGALLPDVEQELKRLPDEFADWKNVYRTRVREHNFRPTEEFRAMAKRVVDGLKQIDSRL